MSSAEQFLLSPGASIGFLRRILETIPRSAFVVFDQALTYVLAGGPKLFDTVGLFERDLVGRGMQEIIPESERSETERLYRATLSGQVVRSNMRRHGKTYAVDMLPVRSATGAITHGIVVAYDLTEVKSAQDELERATSLLRSVLDNMSEGVIVVDNEGAPILFNPAGERIIGGDDVEGSAGLFMADGVTPLAGDHAPLQRVLSGERIEQMEVLERDGKSGGERWYSVSANPLIDPDGVRRGAICVVRDVTRAKTAELSLREQTAFVELLQKITLSANAASSSIDALRECLHLVCAHMQWPLGHVYLLDAEGRELVPSDVWYDAQAERYTSFREVTMRTQFKAGVGLPGRVLAGGKAEWREDLSELADDARSSVSLENGLFGCVAFPVLVAADVVAVLEFFSDARGRPHDRLLNVMQNVGVQLGRAVERERHLAAIEALSLTDELTGLCNRRGFMEAARRQIKILRRQRRSALLFFGDLDGLKQINDKLGHELGDIAIKDVADALRQSFRDTDVIARFGGDEFVVLVTEADVNVSARILERVENNLRRKNANSPRPFTLSLSVGVSVYDPDEPLQLDELLSRADAAMYQRKQQRKLAQQA